MINSKSMGYLFLVLTILSETAAVLCMKLSDGFHNRAYTIFAIITYGLSFVFLTLTLKYLPAGVANAIWAGASAILVAIAGIFILKESLSTWQIISLLLIAVGLVGLNIGKQSA
jgi:small multidrug resistance pump